MKKFLSLVLALIMTMSLVTVSAGAAEYKDFTDKDEIQYEEAVAVLSRLGIINGYSEGDFRPEGVLTRGAAAKIIVSLLIGPEAANNLVVSQAPYNDVPVDHTFAAVISYCKTAGIISGYGDGSFKPGAPLTGYAFSKMLMGALGYKANLEGFVGSGWTMQVAAKAGAAGLFDHISFKGNTAVTREQACQLALNTLKATMVEYSGGFTVSAGDATVSGAQNRSLKVSNQEYARHISNRKANTGAANNAGNDLYTVEFGEEHFVDLRMNTEGTSRDDFGRPSTEWSYKKVTIGTFPLEPDFVFTTKVAYADDDTAAACKRALGMTSGYKTYTGTAASHDEDVSIYVNGEEAFVDGAAGSTWATTKGFDFSSGFDVEDIAALTDNGTLVEVYLDLDEADFVNTVVVVKSQLAEIKRVGSDYVSLQKFDDNDGVDRPKTEDYIDGVARYAGFNQPALDEKLENVEVNDACYDVLKDMKAGDKVVVVPVTDDGVNWTVAEAYKPETVTGSLSKVDTYGKTGYDSGDRTATSVTVGGTKYATSLWNKDIVSINADKIDITKGDVTLTLDKYGNALLAEDVGDTSDYIVVGNYYSNIVNGRIVDFVHGFDMSGNEVDLNLGVNGRVARIHPGDLAQYTNSGTSTTADWRLQDGHGGGFEKPRIYDVNATYGGEYNIKKSDTRIPLVDGVVPADDDDEVGTRVAANFVADGVKFVYVNFNDDGTEVSSVQIVKGVQNVDYDELIDYARKRDGSRVDEDCNAAEAYLNGDGAVKAVVIKNTTGALSSNVLFIRSREGEEGVINGTKIYKYRAAVVDGSNFEEDTVVYSDERLKQGDFATWTKSEFEGVDGTFYKMRELDVQRKPSSSVRADIYEVIYKNTGLIRVTNYVKNGDNTLQMPNLNQNWDASDRTAGNSADTLVVSTKNWVDMSDTKGEAFTSAKALFDYLDEQNEDIVADAQKLTAKIRFVFNDNPTDNNFRNCVLVVVDEIVTRGSRFDSYVEPSDPPVAPAVEGSEAAEESLGTDNLEGLNLNPLLAEEDGDPALEIEFQEKAANAGEHVEGGAKTVTGATVEFEAIARVANTITIDTVVAAGEDVPESGDYLLEVVAPAAATEPTEDTYATYTITTEAAVLEKIEAGELYKANAEYDENDPSKGEEYIAAEASDWTTGTYYTVLDEAASDGTTMTKHSSYIEAAAATENLSDKKVYSLKTGQTENLKVDPSNSSAFGALYGEVAADPNASVEFFTKTAGDPGTDAVAGEWKIVLSKATIDEKTEDGAKVFKVTAVRLTVEDQSGS